jgi:predicted alpha/beta superfamily hydrolase
MIYKTKKLSLKNKVFHKVHEKHYIRGHIERHHIHSSYLSNSRDLDIYLPPSYRRNPNKKYPVLYMHDGNNLFYPSISFGGMPWRIDKTVDKLVNNDLMEEIIVVGIHNTPGRDYEYTWTPMKHGRHYQGGGGEKYASFIVNEVKPFIDRMYRTLPDRNNTAVAGSSLGGLITFYLGRLYPHVFGKVGIISPSFWWDKGIAFKHSQGITNNLQIWMDMGTREGMRYRAGEDINIKLVQTMKYFLNTHGFHEGHNLGYLEDKGGKHNEWSWGNRFHLPLIFFFGKRKSLIFSKV